MAVPFELRTERLFLTRLTAAHLEDLVRLDSDPEVMRYLNGGVPTPREQIETEVLPRIRAWDEQPFGFLAAYEREAFVGWFHLRPSVFDASMLELGYRLRREAWGRGLATEGGRALVRYAFDDLDRRSVDACADPRNTASTGVMIKCGMHPVGVAMHPHAPIEVVRYLVQRA